MKKEQEKRRSFLKHILAGTAVVMGSAAVIKPARAKSATVPKGSDEILYHESEDFKKYYDSIRS